MADIDEAPNRATGLLVRMYRDAAMERDAARREAEGLRKRARKKDAADSRAKAIGLLLRLLREKYAAANDAEEDVQVLRGMVARLESELAEAQAGRMGFDAEPVPFNEPITCTFSGRTLRLTVRARDRDERIQAVEVIGEDGKAALVEIVGRDRYSRISEVQVLH